MIASETYNFIHFSVISVQFISFDRYIFFSKLLYSHFSPHNSMQLKLVAIRSQSEIKYQSPIDYEETISLE